jgi:hypothetical protein
MASIEATVTLAVIFLMGAVIGVIMLVSLAIHREERLVSLGRQAGSVGGAPSGVRMLVSFGRRPLPEGDAVAPRAMR